MRDEIMRVLSNALLLLVLSCAVSWAQQEDPPLPYRIVIVSDRVGITIDPRERDAYGLFPQVERFKEAVFIEASDGNFYARCRTSAPEGGDSVVFIGYSRQLLLYVAEKIEHYEGLADGSYRLHDQPPPPLRYESGLVLEADSVSLRTPDSSRHSRGWNESYPLADATGYVPPASYPLLNLGFSMRTYSPDVSGLQPAYGSSSLPAYWPMFWVEADLMLFREVGLEVAGGASLAKEGWGGTAGIVAYPDFLALWQLRLFVGGGFAFASIKDEPASLVVKGGEQGYYVQWGVEMYEGLAVAVDLLMAYYQYPRIHSTFTESFGSAAGTTYPVSVDLSSLVFGFRLRLLQ